MAFRLDGKTALVTGGNGGLGAAMCMRLAEAGANVAVGWYGKDPAKTNDLVDQITKAGGKAFACPPANVANQDEVQAMVGAIVAHFGGIHIVVNNAGFEDAHKFLGNAAPELAKCPECESDWAFFGGTGRGAGDGQAEQRGCHHQYLQCS